MFVTRGASSLLCAGRIVNRRGHTIPRCTSRPITTTTASKGIGFVSGTHAVRRCFQQHQLRWNDLTKRSLAESSSANTKKAIEQTKTFSLWYPVIGGLVITVAGGIKFVRDELGGFEDLRRAAVFYKFGIPKYLKYRYLMYMQSPDEEWDELDRVTATEGLKIAMELEGFYIKSGQVVAANLGDAFPQIWQDTFHPLLDRVPPQKFDVIEKTLKEELGPDCFTDIFESFEETPIGSAAIGQVHRALLKKKKVNPDGSISIISTPVVVKVRYPDVERQLRGDVRTIKLFAKVAQPVHVPALEETEHQFMTEFDYVKEATQLNGVRENLKRAGLEGEKKLCRVPMAYMDYCTEKVLVMEELHGVKLADGLKAEAKAIAEAEGKTIDEYMENVKEQEREAKAKGEEVKGPSSAEYNVYIGLLDKKRRLSNLFKYGYNWTLGLIPGIKKTSVVDKSSLPINHAQMIDDLMYIHGHEVLVDGMFNGDPHPGNIMLLREDDGSPGLGLIDYGQVKRLSKEMRHIFANLIVALDNDDKENIVDFMKQAGMKTKHMDPEVIYLYARLNYAEITESILKGRHIQVVMEDLEKADPIVELPRDLLMVGRCSLLLRGLAHGLHQNRNVATAWRPIAEKVLKEDV